MCAIFGVFNRSNRPIRIDLIQKIAAAQIGRGPHAFGFAWIDTRGVLHAYRQTGRLTDHLDMLLIARDARVLIGHLRFATHGSPEANINNHPHPADAGWIVHNGVVRNYDQLVRKHRLFPTSECDSEALGLLIEQSPGPRPNRVAAAIRDTTGPLALLGLWSRPATLIIARRGNPLHVGATESALYLATGSTLPGTVRELPDGRLTQYTARDGRLSASHKPLPLHGTDRPSYVSDSLYAGG